MEIKCNYTEKTCPYPMGDDDCSSCDIYKNAAMKFDNQSDYPFSEQVEHMIVVDPKEGVKKIKHDPVNHPAHYTAGGIECIDAIAAALTAQNDPMAAWLTGQCLKYLWRWPLKNGLEDLKKTRFYLDRLIKYVEEK